MIVCEKLANSAYLPLCSIFSNDVHVFRRMENPHDRFTNNTLRINHAKLQTIWLSSFRGEDFQRYTIKKSEKTSKRGNNSHIASRIFTKFGREVDLIMLNKSFPQQKFAKPYKFWDICEKLPSDPPVLFLVTAAMFFDELKIPTVVLFTIP